MVTEAVLEESTSNNRGFLYAEDGTYREWRN
jgi:hypothetical protein